MNNGILDVTLKLTPQGSALSNSDTESDADLDEDFEDDDYFPASQKVSLEILDEDDEDDEEDDDGGIPIF